MRRFIYGSLESKWSSSYSAKPNWTFASSHGWGAISGYWSKLWCSKGVGHFKRKFYGEEGRPPTTVGNRKLESLGYHVALFAWSYVKSFWYNTGVFASEKQTRAGRRAVSPTQTRRSRGIQWLHCVPKKEDTKLMAVTLSFLNRFWKFFHWHTQR